MPVPLVRTLHQLDVAMEYGDRIIGMKAGRVQLDHSKAQFERDVLNDLYHGEVRVDAVPSPASWEQAPEPAV